jgi:DNA-binding transcriptional regulator YiaG
LSGLSSSSGEAIRLILMPPTSRRFGSIIEAARVLIRAGASTRAARKVVDTLLAGKSAFVIAPNVRDFERFRSLLMAENLAVHRIEQHSVDVRALRVRLEMSQAEFAGRYGLDLATLRNWEQGRTTPDSSAATLLQLIERDPPTIAGMLET